MTDNWRREALCGTWPDVDLWFREGPDRHLALHLCRSHCPVRNECDTANSGLRNAACVVAGIAYNQHGNIADQQKQSSVNCPTCIAARQAAHDAAEAAKQAGVGRFADCGTARGYYRHRRGHETPCRACSAAGAQERARQREAKAQAAA